MQRRVVKLGAAVLVGVQACAVAVDVVPIEGPSTLRLVGWKEASARELRVRVEAALCHLFGEPLVGAFEVRAHGVPPEWLGGGELDLVVAVGLVAAMGRLDVSQLDGVGLIGELALDGRLRIVRGAFVIGSALRWAGVRWLLGADENRDELGAVGVRAGTVANLGEVLAVLRGEIRFADRDPLVERESLPPGSVRTNYEQGLRDALRAVDSGVRVLALEGPQLSSQTLIARQLWQRLPPLGFDERREVLAIQSAAGLFRQGSAVARPFRAPHHSVSDAGLVGGGQKPRAGELTLAHRGVLFLDQLGEFRRSGLDALAVGWRRRELEVSSFGRSLRLPADPALIVVSLQTCPCGWSGSAQCRCTREQKARYRGREYGRFGECIECVVRVGGEFAR